MNVQGNDTTTNVLSSVVNRYNNTDYTYSYDFDDFGNISKITYGNYENTYEYDKLNQLTRENNEELGKTYVFTYDKGGNITSAKTYNYTEEAVSGDPISTETYTYGDSDWKDLLTSYNNHAITYDNIGNPLTYHDGKTFTWNFRRLEKIVDGNTTIEYKYNQDGIRISKKVGSTTTNYVVSGNRILQETTGTNTIIYEYDALGNASSFVYNGTRYIYVRNGTNDVVGILNSSGSLVASYKYDGWGNCTVANTSGTDIGNINPIRYRSYYYDSETGYYYLNSRYYDSNVGRFISPDISLNDDTTGNNNFVYCGNNPILYKDTTGEWFYVALAGGLFSAAAQIVSNVLPVAEGETQPLWYDGALPAFAGGFVSGMFTGVSALTTISKPLQIILSSSADMVGAVVEETMSYVLKEKELSKNNVINSAASIVVDVAVSTKISNKINVDKFAKKVNADNNKPMKRGFEILNQAISSSITFLKDLFTRTDLKNQSSNYSIKTKKWWQ